ncbi:hypothetical protein ACFOY8_12255 [Thalassospira xianhensis]|uniref:Uncharacterized protein n=1 Tax=Thalassospira xianhensis MCCC 1A02616 TaxID=1177929 RepID=A0A367UH29_9PROT|nr:hypothetical protein [Thalassospira xianhensis]RCK06362.1 hypothetical protein TH5_09190 [Thalassospira xianhensis MCCC 1A02616]
MKDDIVYRLRSTTPAKKTAKKLKALLAPLGMELRLSYAQETAAKLMGYDDWQELIQSVASEDHEGPADEMLDDATARKRTKHQKRVLSSVLGSELAGEEVPLLWSLRATGMPNYMLPDFVGRLGLRLTDEDLKELEAFLESFRMFEQAARTIFSYFPTPPNGVDPQSSLVRIELDGNFAAPDIPVPSVTREEEIEFIKNDQWMHILNQLKNWDNLPEADDFAIEEACEHLATAYWNVCQKLKEFGSAPVLLRLANMRITMWRSIVNNGKVAPFYTALSPEPVLRIVFDLWNFRYSAANEGSASKAIALQVALRREFLDSGWTEGQGTDWKLVVRESNGPRQDLTIKARTPEEAFAYAAAARGALRMLKGQKAMVFRIIEVNGQKVVGEEAARIVAGAMGHPIIKRGILFDGKKLR